MVLFVALLLLAADHPAVVLLQKHCVSCHGETPARDLDLRTRETALRGGLRGPAIKPGDVLESLLYRTITHENERLKMPLDKPKLSDADIKTIKLWIQDGAPWEAEKSDK